MRIYLVRVHPAPPVSELGVQALDCVREHCRTIERIFACGGDQELVTCLLKDIESGLQLWAEEGGRGEE